MHIFLSPKGRALKRTRVLLAEAVNEVAMRGVASADIAATRRALLAMLVNLAREDLESQQGTVAVSAEVARRHRS